MLVEIASDGFATKALTDTWATGLRQLLATAFHIALAVEEVQNAVFHTWSAMFIGLPLLLTGLSGLFAGGGFPRWLGAIAVIGGAGGVFMGVSGFVHMQVPGVLFNVFALLVTLWVLVADVLVWRATSPSCRCSRRPDAIRLRHLVVGPLSCRRAEGRLVWRDDRPGYDVVVDGRPLSWEEFGAVLEPFEGWTFRLSIQDIQTAQ